MDCDAAPDAEQFRLAKTYAPSWTPWVLPILLSCYPALSSSTCTALLYLSGKRPTDVTQLWASNGCREPAHRPCLSCLQRNLLRVHQTNVFFLEGRLLCRGPPRQQSRESRACDVFSVICDLCILNPTSDGASAQVMDNPMVMGGFSGSPVRHTPSHYAPKHAKDG